MALRQTPKLMPLIIQQLIQRVKLTFKNWSFKFKSYEDMKQMEFSCRAGKGGKKGYNYFEK